MDVILRAVRVVEKIASVHYFVMGLGIKIFGCEMKPTTISNSAQSNSPTIYGNPTCWRLR